MDGHADLVIQRWPHARRFIARARLRAGEPTPAGRDFALKLAAIDGIDADHAEPGNTNSGFGTTVHLVHEALWSWDEIEPKVVAAYAELLGIDDLRIEREDRNQATDG